MLTIAHPHVVVCARRTVCRYVRCLITTNRSYMFIFCKSPYRVPLGDVLLPSLNSSGTHSPLRPSSKTSCAACLRPMRSRPQPTPWTRHERYRACRHGAVFQSGTNASCKSSQHQIWPPGGCPLAVFQPWARTSQHRRRRKRHGRPSDCLLHNPISRHLPHGSLYISWTVNPISRLAGTMPIASSRALTSSSSGCSGPAMSQARINCRDDRAPDDSALGAFGIASQNGQFPHQRMSLRPQHCNETRRDTDILYNATIVVCFVIVCPRLCCAGPLWDPLWWTGPFAAGTVREDLGTGAREPLKPVKPFSGIRLGGSDAHLPSH